VKSELAKLVELQKTDTLIKQLKTAIETVTQRRGAIEQEFEARAFSIREIQQKREAANVARLKIETEMAETKSKIERAERNLKASQNQKQYEAAMRESDVLKKALAELETKETEALATAEEVDKVLAERATEIAGIDAERIETLRKFDAEVEAQSKKFNRETGKRQEVFKTLPKNLASVYDRLIKRSRDGIAVAEVKNGACSACFMKLRPQLAVDVKMTDRLINCEGCSRILYYQAAEASEVAVAK
jgi:uncharacterized protein